MKASERTQDTLGYGNVAVCLKERPKWEMWEWADLSDELFPETYLVRPDELIVSAGAEASLDPGWEFVKKVGSSSLYYHTGAPANTTGPRSGGLVMETLATNPNGLEPNAVFCSCALRSPPPDPVVQDETGEALVQGVNAFAVRVAPRYQGLGAQARPAVLPPDLTPPRRQDGRRIQVGVIDTGLAQGDYLSNWLEPCIPPRFLVSADAEDPPDSNRDKRLDGVAGHGTFVAGVIAQCTPSVDIHVTRAVDREGVVATADLVVAIERLRSSVDGKLDILNLSLGAWTHDDEAPKELADQLDALYSDGTAIVAAAGNLQSERKVWPGAMEKVIGVGALTPKGDELQPTEYSSRGNWVKAWCEGNRVSTFFTNFTSQPEEGNEYASPTTFDGAAMWDGTSMAAPHVAGSIARTMLDENLESHAAWEHLRERLTPHGLAPSVFGNAAIVPG